MSDESSATTWRIVPPLPGPLDSPPASVEVDAEFGARSRRGPLKPHNDDHYVIARLGRDHDALLTSIDESDLPRRFQEQGYGMVVADGMGGAGEAASRLAITTLLQLTVDFGKWHVRVNEAIADEMMDRAERFYRSVDATLRHASRSSPRRLQATMTAVYSAGAELFFAHVGRSRAYVFREDRLMRLTRDHALALERPPGSSPTHAASPVDARPLLTDALGRKDSTGPRIDVERCGLQDNDRVLLCTKGLIDVADDAQIAAALRSHDAPDDLCRALIELAADRGADDDVTVLVGHYHVRTRTDVT